MLIVSQLFHLSSGRRRRPAFSLVEIIVILFVISLGLVAILSLIIQNIQSQSYNKHNLIAYQLAQEGVELIRQVRDSNWRAGSAFTIGLATTTSVSYQNYMDYRDAVPHPFVGDPAVPTLLRQDSAGLYIHGAVGTTTPYSRLILTEKLDDKSLQVNSIVSWQDHERDYSYDLETILYDWY